MAKVDKQKEWVGVWKIALFFLLGTEFSLIAFIFNNFDRLSEVKLLFLTFALIIIGFSVVFSAVYLKKEIDKLEEIDE
ncbi:MAG: hypothetical protein GXO62_04990 [Epsilonproteobacteria bacterium]|nr:hypothetical protein [Campylobacterota bacterium]